MKIGVEGKEEVQTQACTMSSTEAGGGLGVLLPASDSFVVHNPVKEEDENSCHAVSCSDSDSNVEQLQTSGNGHVLEEVGSWFLCFQHFFHCYCEGLFMLKALSSFSLKQEYNAVEVSRVICY